MREPKNQMLGTMEPPLMQLSVKTSKEQSRKRSYQIIHSRGKIFPLNRWNKVLFR